MRKTVGTAPTSPCAIRHTLILLSALFVFCVPLSSQASEERPTIVIVGATARTAETLIPMVIGSGYTVVGIARRPETVTFSVEHLVRRQHSWDRLRELRKGEFLVHRHR